GKPTLPIIFAIKQGSDEQAETIRQAIINGDASNIESIIATLTETGAFDYCQQQAQKYTEQAVAAISSLADSDYKSAMMDLAKLALGRTN
ncbi:MAG: polyprenyl synthetase family protein, partial [Kangiellaceae bacterium]|nr:polyprenyl synthetase family protein [Kangiellaceae bacterium]